MQFLVDERYPLHIYRHGTENRHGMCLKIDVLREVKRQLRIVCVERESLQFDQCFRPFFSHFAIVKFHIVQFPDTSSAGKTVRTNLKDTSIFWLLVRI